MGPKRRNPLTAELVSRFKALFDGVPNWAWPVTPSIPFIGRHFRPGRGLLIYASAENLSWMNKEATPPRFTGETAWDRYRAQYEEAGRVSGEFFPNVGIQPVTDGGLLAAGLFVAEHLGLPTRTVPRAFLETVAVSNWCKFSVQSVRNSDYIDVAEKLTSSLPFVISEVAILQPHTVLVPKSVWGRTVLRAAMRGASPHTRFMPIPQCNPRVVNTHLRRYAAEAATIQRSMKGTWLADWMRHARGFRTENAWRFIAALVTECRLNAPFDPPRPPAGCLQ